jgi:hypothetical protein
VGGRVAPQGLGQEKVDTAAGYIARAFNCCTLEKARMSARSGKNVASSKRWLA